MNPRGFDCSALAAAKHYREQWHLHTDLNPAQADTRASVRCDAAWRALGHGGDDSVVVAVVDDGCWVSHPGFSRSAKFAGAAAWNENALETTDDAAFLEDRLLRDGRTHGTSMCALIAAEPGGLTVGVAPGCRLLPVSIPVENRLAHLSDELLLAVLDFVDARADVLVFPWTRVPFFQLSRQVTERFAELGKAGGRRGKGLVIVCAAGNSNCPIDHSSSVAVPYALGYTTANSAPTMVRSRTFRNSLVSVREVLHVGAITSRARRARYSSYGAGLDICAPSSDGRVFSDELDGLGLTTSYGPPLTVTHAFKGTSGAAALVAGAAALVVSANKELSAADICDVLKRTASRDLNTLEDAPTPQAPWEVPPIDPFHHGEFNADGWSPWFGFGRVDAHQAVLEAIQRLTA